MLGLVEPVHLVTEVKASVYSSGCGKSFKSKDGMPDNLSGWSSDITCPLCATRLFVVHKRLENLVEMKKSLDLDDPTVAKKFHFSGKKFGFRWLLGGRLVYVYESPEGFSPMMALCMQNFVPDTLEREPMYTDAQTVAREWIIKHGDNFASTGKSPAKKHRQRIVKTAPSKPKIPEGYEGPLCKSCGKHDEGDFMPHPELMLEHLCMTCLVSGKK